ncbi:MAG: hypothetical protein U9P79_00520 [Candidatus Cloacimonadota bacterium]|nr:hypothetical protein [Candidatus Cloacimonadota bacterium]
MSCKKYEEYILLDMRLYGQTLITVSIFALLFFLLTEWRNPSFASINF